jgi:hemoglobin
MPTLPDITVQEDVHRLVERFYARARPDPLIGHFFVDIDWEPHIRLIASFWNMVLFGDRTYQRDPLTAHVLLHQRIPMEQAHFDRWLALFNGTVDELFQGAKAEEAKQRARTIAGVMLHKVRTTPS